MFLRQLLPSLALLSATTTSLPLDDNNTSLNTTLSRYNEREFESVAQKGLDYLMQRGLFRPTWNVTEVMADVKTWGLKDGLGNFRVHVVNPDGARLSMYQTGGSSADPQWLLRWWQPDPTVGSWPWGTSSNLPLQAALKIVKDQGGVTRGHINYVRLFWPLRDYITFEDSTEPWYKFTCGTDAWYVAARTGRNGRNLHRNVPAALDEQAVSEGGDVESKQLVQVE